MKKYSIKFWIIFWSVSGIFLSAWFFYWNINNKGIFSTFEKIIHILPVDDSRKKEYIAAVALGDFFLKNKNEEKTLMVLFQNNMEIRPGGGFIGAFGIVKIKGGKLISMETNDLSNFDSQIPNNIIPPYPILETGVAKSWKLRDSNFSPDFETNAKKAQEFYQLGNGKEKIDGVIGITTNVLTSILKITGPISIEGYPGTYNSENAALSLEYQVEKAFEKQGINRVERKSVMTDLAKEIEKRISSFSIFQKIRLAQILSVDLKKKDIQLNFNNAFLQEAVFNANWGGSIDKNWKSDYLMTVDANMGSFKSDYYIKRSIDYTVDLSKNEPLVNLKINYTHTAKQKDWMTRNYTDYLRVYVPEKAALISQVNFDGTQFGNEFGKAYFGSIINVPIGETKTIEINYTLPKYIKNNYQLKIKKQAGLDNVPVMVHIINIDGSERYSNLLMDSDTILN